MNDLYAHHYPEQYNHLLSNVSNHEMTILQDNELYKHLRFRAPGTSMWGFDIITWPGYLTIVGDIGDGYIFHLEQNMLRFFDHSQPDGNINPGYWAEKLTRSITYEEYSPDVFTRTITDLATDLRDHIPWDDHQRFNESITDDVLSHAENGETYARDALHNFTFTDSTNTQHTFNTDTQDHNFTDYKYHFILALHAILWGAKTYHTHQKQTYKKHLETLRANHTTNALAVPAPPVSCGTSAADSDKTVEDALRWLESSDAHMILVVREDGRVHTRSRIARESEVAVLQSLVQQLEGAS